MLQKPQMTTFINSEGKEARYFEPASPFTYYRWRQSLSNPSGNKDLEVDYIFREDGVVMQEFCRLLSPIIRVRFNWLDLEQYYTLSASSKAWITEPQRTAAAQLDWKDVDINHVPDHIRYHHSLNSFLRPRSMKISPAKFDPNTGWQRIELPDQYFIREKMEGVRRRLKYVKQRKLTIWLAIFVFFVWLTQPWLIPLIHNILDLPYQLQNWLFSH